MMEELYALLPGFEQIDPPLTYKEKVAIKQSRQRRDLHFWNGHLLTEREKALYCVDLRIHSRVIPHSFDNALEARIWTIRYNLEHRDMEDFWQYWLIGELFLCERAALPNPPKWEPGLRTRIIRECNISRSRFENYLRYALGIRVLYAADKEITKHILAGDVFLSLNNMRRLMSLPEEEFLHFLEELRHRNGIAESRVVMDLLGAPAINDPDPAPVNTRTIKDMPEYDPDAEAVSLLWTLPSWTGQIRKIGKTDLYRISGRTSEKLIQELLIHRAEIQDLLRQLRKANDENEKSE